MKAWIIILMLAVAVARGATKTPINNGVLQSNLDAAGYKITNANLVDYAGTGLTWNVATNKFEATGGGGGGGGGTPGGSTTQFQYNNAGAFGGISSVTYDGTIPITISKDVGADTRFTGVKLVNPTTPALNGEGRQSPAIHLIEKIKDTGGTQHTYDHMIWGEAGSILFGTSIDGSAVGGTGHSIVQIDGGGNILPYNGDQILRMAQIDALDWVQTGGDASHPARVGLFNDSTPAVPGIGLANNGEIWWDVGSTWTLARGDTSLKRSAVGVLKLSNSLELNPVAVSALPTAVLGRIATVNDGAGSLSLGATVTGGGSSPYLVWNNGTNWLVTGGGAAGGGAVTSVFTRTGAVVAATNDYTFAQIGSKPTTLSGYGITDAQPLSTNLTTWAALAPSANFQTMSGHTFAQMRTDLGLVIGTNVEAWDTDLDTWAAITRASGFDTFTATPSSANLRGLLTDENGTGAALFSGATTPDFTTGITIGGAAASGKVLMGNGTSYTTSTASFPTGAPGSGKLLAGNGSNYVLTTPTYPNAAGAVGYTIRSDATNFASYPAQLVNSSTSSQATFSTSDIYVAGSNIAVTAGDFKAGGQYKCVFDMTKSAGTGAIVITLRVGTLGTTGDAAIQTFTFGAGTGVADLGIFEVIATWRSVGSGTSAVIQGMCRCTHQLSTTGLISNAGGWMVLGSPSPSSGFASNTATNIGISFNGSTAFAGTATMVQAQLQQ